MEIKSKIVIERTDTRDGLVNARAVNGTINVTLHSIQPRKEAERVLSRLNPNMEWNFIAGFGLGYIVEEVLKNPLSKVAVFEPLEDIINFAGNNRDLSGILKNDRLFFIHDIKEIVPFFESRDIREMNYYLHRPYASLFPEVFAGMEGILTSYLSKRQINKNTLKRFRMVWLRNLIKNLRYYYTLPGIDHIAHSFEGKPALIVGAGPSLAKNIELISRNADKMVIIATDTSLPMLRAFGIMPDFTVSADPQDKNALFLLYSCNPPTNLIIDSAGSFLTFSKFFPKNTILFDSFFPIYRELSALWGVKGDLKSGGSVSTTAFDFARFLKCSPIILAGQDLSFSGKKTHYKNNILEDFLYYRVNRIQTYDNYHAGAMVLADRIMIDGYSGGKVPTDRKFLTFLEWFKREIPLSDVPVINATEGGAFIPGAEHIPFKDAVNLYLKEKLDKNIRFDFRPVDMTSNPGYIDDIAAECRRLLPFAQKAYSDTLRAIGDYRQRKNVSGYFQSMTEFDRQVLTSLKSGNAVSRFMEIAMQESIDKIMESANAGKDISLDLLEDWRALYKDALNGIKKILHLLSKAEALNSSSR